MISENPGGKSHLGKSVAIGSPPYPKILNLPPPEGPAQQYPEALHGCIENQL